MPDAVTVIAGSSSAVAEDVTRLLDRAQAPSAVDSPRTGSVDVGFEPGAVLAGRYRIVRSLGRGGMGIVYHADDLRLGHQVALKFLPPDLAADPRRLAQFHSEVSVARQISHPNVCRVYDIGDVDGHLFLSMEFIDGEDLSSALRRRGSFPEPEAVELIRQVCAGLSAVHGRGILHRDLKPANIMLGAGGQVHLMDFGIAGSAGAEHAVEGTPAYMAPEQLLGKGLTTQTDIYALGLIIHEILTGKSMFGAHTLEQLVAQHASAEAAAAEVPAGITPTLRKAMLACLERDPAARPASAQAVAAMLQTVLLDEQTRWRRLVQIVLPAIAAFLWVATLNYLYRVRMEASLYALPFLAGAVAMTIAGLRYPVGWTVAYKGHKIRFSVHPIFGERLHIDDTLVDRGRVGFGVTMRGTIESGAGAGERITARSRCTFTRVACTIVAESFAA